MTSQGGGRYERELVNRLWNLGWFAMRAGSSGSATAHHLPDVLAVTIERREDAISLRQWAIEHKTVAAGEYAYLEADEIRALAEIERRGGFRPRASVRWKQDTTIYLRQITSEAYYTSEGSLRLDPDDRDDWPGSVIETPENGGGVA